MRLRDLVPWRDFVIETSWSPEVTMVELAKRVDAPRLPFFGIDRPEVPFHGKAVSATDLEFRHKADFPVRRAISMTIRASVEPARVSGAIVRVRIGSRTSGGVILVLVTVFAMTCVAVALFALISGDVRSAVVGLGIPAFVVALSLVPFAIEAATSERILRGIFKRAPALPPPDPPHETGEPYR